MRDPHTNLQKAHVREYENIPLLYSAVFSSASTDAYRTLSVSLVEQESYSGAALVKLIVHVFWLKLLHTACYIINFVGKAEYTTASQYFFQDPAKVCLSCLSSCQTWTCSDSARVLPQDHACGTVKIAGAVGSVGALTADRFTLSDDPVKVHSCDKLAQITTTTHIHPEFEAETASKWSKRGRCCPNAT
eukprot:5019502-Amphidinium_carterae.1